MKMNFCRCHRYQADFIFSWTVINRINLLYFDHAEKTLKQVFWEFQSKRRTPAASQMWTNSMEMDRKKQRRLIDITCVKRYRRFRYARSHNRNELSRILWKTNWRRNKGKKTVHKSLVQRQTIKFVNKCTSAEKKCIFCNRLEKCWVNRI